MTRCSIFPPGTRCERDATMDGQMDGNSRARVFRTQQGFPRAGNRISGFTRSPRFHAVQIAQSEVIARLSVRWAPRAPEERNRVLVRSRWFALTSICRVRQRARREDEKYSRPCVREDAQSRSATAVSRRGYVPSWMWSNCRQPGPKYTCSYNGVLPRKEQAVRYEHERCLLCVEKAPRCGGTRSSLRLRRSRPMRSRTAPWRHAGL